MEKTKGSGFTVIELAVVIAIFLVMIISLTPFVRMARERANAIKCADNLRKISLALHLYAADHNDSFPAKLAELYPNYVDDEKTFDCPATKAPDSPAETDYAYTAGLTEASGPKDIIVRDLDGNHGRFGKNVLKVDGSVGWKRTRR